MKYVPITLVDVNHSFFLYKNILSHDRDSFTTENLIKYMLVDYFFNLINFFLFVL
jgi:hypothetical protein